MTSTAKRPSELPWSGLRGAAAAVGSDDESTTLHGVLAYQGHPGAVTAAPVACGSGASLFTLLLGRAPRSRHSVALRALFTLSRSALRASPHRRHPRPRTGRSS